MAAGMSDDGERARRRLLWWLSSATFLIFFQAFMVAPLLPRLAHVFGVSVETMGLVVPAYFIPYGAATLVYGPLSDRLGRGRVIFGSLVAFIVLTALTATVQSAAAMTVLRLLTGLGASGVVPIALALVGDLVPFRQRGRWLGWLFGAVAGGMAFGSTAGVMLEPVVMWRGLFLGVSTLAALVLVLLLPYRWLMIGRPSGAARVPYAKILAGYWALLVSGRGRRTYGYVLFNAVFHSGVYTWLGLYFARRYGLGELGIGLALLGYGVPGLLLGPPIGRAADRWGRSWLIPGGLAIAGISAATLAVDLQVVAAALLVTTLSLGFAMTQPLLAGIVTDLGPNKGQAMGLNAFTLFTGSGTGSLVFVGVMAFGLEAALVLFGAAALVAAGVAIPLFRDERTRSAPTKSEEATRPRAAPPGAAGRN